MRSPLVYLRWTVFFVLVAGLISVAFSLAVMRSKIDTIDDGSINGPVWMVMSLEYDLFRFELALADFILEKTDATAVNLRFDLLWSRVATVRSGETAQLLQDYKAPSEVFEQLHMTLEETDAEVTHIEEANPLELNQLAIRFGSHSEALHNATLSVLQENSIRTKALRDELLYISQINSLTSIAVAVFLLLILLLYVIESIQTKRQLKEKDGLLEQAHAANIAKSQFISVINHELRTPLTSVVGAISLVKSDALGKISPKARSVLELADRNCEQLSALITDLLDVDKFDANRVEYQFSELNLSSFLREQAKINSTYAQEFGVAIVADPDMPDLTVWADARRLGQVTSNLLSNAAKFSTRGETIKINLTQQGENAVFSVADNGRGIPEAEQARIFDRFHQVDSSNERERGGTGLGLSIVRSVVEAHGGRVTLTSVLGEGTTFFVELPLHARSDSTQE